MLTHDAIHVKWRLNLVKRENLKRWIMLIALKSDRYQSQGYFPWRDSSLKSWLAFTYQQLLAHQCTVPCLAYIGFIARWVNGDLNQPSWFHEIWLTWGKSLNLSYLPADFSKYEQGLIYIERIILDFTLNYERPYLSDKSELMMFKHKIIGFIKQIQCYLA